MAILISLTLFSTFLLTVLCIHVVEVGVHPPPRQPMSSPVFAGRLRLSEDCRAVASCRAEAQRRRMAKADRQVRAAYEAASFDSAGQSITNKVEFPLVGKSGPARSFIAFCAPCRVGALAKTEASCRDETLV